MTKQKLTGTVVEIRHDDREMTIDIAPDAPAPVRMQLTWNEELDDQTNEIGERCEVVANAVITGWADMPYPHLTHDEMSGELHRIKEIW